MSINVVVLGDICSEWGFSEQFAKGDPACVFHDIIPILQTADLVVANLESPATDAYEKLQKNSVNLKAKPNDVSVLKKAGIDGLALANNHILDYGTKGLSDTIGNLEKNDMFYYGLSDVGNRSSVYISDINGYRIGFLAFAEHEFNCAVDYDCGAALWDDLESPLLIRDAKSKCDYIIVQYHGGIEHYVYPSPFLQKKCRAMADAGADFVTCQHSHCIGSHEKWHGAEILYGQGNMIFGMNSTKGWNEGLIAEISINDKVEIAYIPVKAHADGEYLATEVEAQVILDDFEQNSKDIKDSDFVRKQWDAFCQRRASEYLPMQFAWGRVANKLNRMTSGKFIKVLTKKTDRRNAMNLIRCDAHREVMQTILEKEIYHD